MPTSGDISLYVHIPFCKKKCPYCHFYILPNRELHREMYLAALLKEINNKLAHFKDRTLASVYFGGGTPSLFPEVVGEVLSLFQKEKIVLKDDFECTFEANPEDITPSLVETVKGFGVNRISMGVQSLSDSSLSILGRGHVTRTCLQAIETVYQGGIENISIDLMYDLPHQKLQEFEETLRAVKDLPITHLSLYNLTFEPHTVFYKRRKELLPHVPTPEASFRMLESAVSLLTSFGYERYEISAFMKGDCYSRHNTGYWTGRPFLGFGPSAFSYWEGRRFQNTPNLLRYVNQLEQNQTTTNFSETLPEEEKQKELFAVQLRLLQGVDLVHFGKLSTDLEKAIDSLKKEGFLKEEKARILLTEKGLLFHDSVAEALI